MATEEVYVDIEKINKLGVHLFDYLELNKIPVKEGVLMLQVLLDNAKEEMGITIGDMELAIEKKEIKS